MAEKTFFCHEYGEYLSGCSVYERSQLIHALAVIAAVLAHEGFNLRNVAAPAHGGKIHAAAFGHIIAGLQVVYHEKLLP